MMRVLFLVVMLFSGVARADAVATLKRFVDVSASLEARFVQTLYARDGKKPRQVSGQLHLARPDRFRWEVTKPYQQLLVSDGKKIWFYDPDLKQVTVKALGDHLAGSPAALLAGAGALEKRFELKTLSDKDGAEWVEAIPKNRDSGFERIRIGFVGERLKTMELLDSMGQLTVTDFSEVVKNPVLDSARMFRFVPPSGVDVVGDAEKKIR